MMMQTPLIEAINLSIGYSDHVIQQKLNFVIKSQQIVAIMGATGAGKSTLLHTLVGLNPPITGDVLYDGESFWQGAELQREFMTRQFGMMYQNSALWESMTLEENIVLPLRQLANLSKEQARSLAHYKLSLVGLNGYEDYLPKEISQGMRKRVSLVRAMALDPKILFLDNPSDGIDPIYTQSFNELLRTLRDVYGTTILIATNDVSMIYSLADYILFLDHEEKTLSAAGDLNQLLSLKKDTAAYQYLTCGNTVYQEKM